MLEKKAIEGNMCHTFLFVVRCTARPLLSFANLTFYFLFLVGAGIKKKKKLYNVNLTTHFFLTLSTICLVLTSSHCIFAATAKSLTFINNA